MEKMKSTCKVFDMFGVEIGDYAVVLENDVVLTKPLAGGEQDFEIIPDDSGEVEVSEETAYKVQRVNEQLAEIDALQKETGLPVTTSFEEFDGEDPDA